MHQTTQRRTCRLMFLVGCILPTLAVMAWATVGRLPSTTAARLALVEQALGMRVTAGLLSTPTPGVFRVRELELANVETGAVVFTAEMATLHRTGGTMQIRLSGTRLAESELPLVATAVRSAVSLDWPAKVRIQADGLGWWGEVEDSHATILKGKRATVALDTLGNDNQVVGRTCVVDLGEGSGGFRLEVHRNRQMSPPATQIVLDTAGESVPCEWLSSLGAIVAKVGSDAQFAGRATMTHMAGTTSGQLHGKLTRVSLAEATQLPIHTAVAVNELSLHWAADRVTQAEGVVVGGAGTMSGSFAKTLQQLYEARQAGSEVTAQESIAFGTLAVEFELGDECLSLRGACPTADRSSPAPCIVDSDGRVLFGYPTFRAPIAWTAGVLANQGGASAAEVAARLPVSRDMSRRR